MRQLNGYIIVVLIFVLINCQPSTNGNKSSKELELDSAKLVSAYLDSMQYELLVTDTAEAIKKALERQEKWIEYIDDGRYSRSWNRASSTFQSFYTKEQWIANIISVYVPLGKREYKALDTAYYTTAITGYPPNRDYVHILHKSKFENRADTLLETTIMIKERRRWKTAVYSVLF